MMLAVTLTIDQPLRPKVLLPKSESVMPHFIQVQAALRLATAAMAQSYSVRKLNSTQAEQSRAR